MLAILVFIIPKIGAASDLAIKIPTPETEDWYLRSVNHAVDAFHDMLDKLLKDGNASLALANIDLDTGNRVKLEDYPLADQTYAQLLERITSEPNRPIPEYLRKNILEYYASSASDPDLSKRLSERLEILMKMKISDDQWSGRCHHYQSQSSLRNGWACGGCGRYNGSGVCSRKATRPEVSKMPFEAIWESVKIANG